MDVRIAMEALHDGSQGGFDLVIFSTSDSKRCCADKTSEIVVYPVAQLVQKQMFLSERQARGDFSHDVLPELGQVADKLNLVSGKTSGIGRTPMLWRRTPNTRTSGATRLAVRHSPPPGAS